MKINYLELNNFLSFGKDVLLDLTEVKYPVLVKGHTTSEHNSNGAGKSALFEAIYWVLTGKTVRGISSKAVINYGKTSCSVQVGISFFGNTLNIKRLYSANKKTVNIIYNGNEESFHDSKQATNRIFNLLNTDAKTLFLACFYGTYFKSFSMFSSSEKADLIDLISQSYKWGDAQAYLTLIKHENTGDKEALCNKINNNNQMIEVLANQFDILEKDLRIRIADNKHKIKELQASILMYNDALIKEKSKKSTRGNISKIEKEVEELLVSKGINDNNLNNSLSVREEIKNNIQSSRKDRDVLIASVKKDCAIEKKLLCNYIKQKNTGVCIECSQKLPVDFDVEHKLLVAKKTYKEKNNVLSTLVKENNKKYADEAGILQQAKVTEESNIKEISATYNKINKSIEDKKHIINMFYNKINKYTTEILKFEQAMQYAKKEIIRLENDEHISRDIERKNKLLNDIKLKKAAEKDFKNQEKSLRMDREVMEYWHVGFKDIRYSLFSNTLKIMEELLNSICKQQGLDFDNIAISETKTLSNKRTVPDVTVEIYRNDAKMGIGAFSEGELQRFNLACFWAISIMIENHLGYSINLKVLDEPLSGIDFEGKQKIFDMINDMASKKQLFVIDHDANFQDKFTTVLTVKKDKTSELVI